MHLKNTVFEEDRLEFSSTIYEFHFYILYAGKRSFVLKINGVNQYKGFDFIETNKGTNLHNNSSEPDFIDDFIKMFEKNYKKSFIVSNTYKDFLLSYNNSNWVS